MAVVKKKVLGHRVPVECHEMLDELVKLFSTEHATAHKETILEKAIVHYYEANTGKKKGRKSKIAEKYGANE